MAPSKWLDITLTIRPGMVRWPGDPPVSIRRMNNMDRGDADNVSFLALGSHTGTHMDAPRHCLIEGRGLARMPLEATVGRARILAIKDRQRVTIEELRPYKIRRGERIIFKTRNSAYWRRPTSVFQRDYVYIPLATAQYLVKLGVRTVGIDYLSVGSYYAEGAETHGVLLKAGIWIIESLDLSRVKPGDYDLVCLPLKILDSDGAPCRAAVKRMVRNANFIQNENI